MSKDPAFLFYPGDWLGGTLGMTFEEKGAYMELLMLQFNSGHMTTHMIGHTVGQLWDKIQRKFKQDEDGLWYNERLDIEKNKRKAFINSRKNNISGKNQHTNKVGHMTSHMENENTLLVKYPVIDLSGLNETEKRLQGWKWDFSKYQIELAKKFQHAEENKELIQRFAELHPDCDAKKTFHNCFNYWSTEEAWNRLKTKQITELKAEDIIFNRSKYSEIKVK